MQAEELTAGTFLEKWKNLIFMHCQRVVGPISEAIITFVEKREAQLLNNDILLAAVFVDAPNLVLLHPLYQGFSTVFLPFTPSQLPNIKFIPCFLFTH